MFMNYGKVSSLKQLPAGVQRKMFVRGLIRDLDEGIDPSLVATRAKSKKIELSELIFDLTYYLKQFK